MYSVLVDDFQRYIMNVEDLTNPKIDLVGIVDVRIYCDEGL